MATRRRKSLFPNQPNSPLQPSPSLAIPVEPVAPPLLLLALLATTGALGTLYSLFTPSAVIETRSRTPASALNAAAGARANGAFTAVGPRVLPYLNFADKRNVVNQLFVKKGWFWTSLLAGIFIIVSYAFPPTLSMRPPSPSHPESDANDLGPKGDLH